MSKAIHRFATEISANVQGWMGPRQAMIVQFLDEWQRAAEVVGDIAEIGVHHGQFLFLLAAVRRNAELVHAFDVFDDQAANIDQSGNGSREILEAGINRWYDPAYFRVTQIDSLALRGKADAYLRGPVRLFSVDGGHTRLHAASDLMIANDFVSAGGVVILDDFNAILWPGVTEGFYDFMRFPGVKLAPFLYFENKLFLTTKEEHATVSLAIEEKIRTAIGEEIHNGLWKHVEITGSRVLVRSRD